MKSMRRSTSESTMSLNLSVFIRLISLSSQGITREPSTEYIHLTAISMARRQFNTLADGSMA